MGAAIAPDYFTALWAGATGGEQWDVLEYTGAVPVEITASGEPLLDYLVKGNMQQTGTPSPQTVIFPEETGERTINLYDINAKDTANGYINSRQLNADGSESVWGSAEISEYIPIKGSTAYSFNGIGSYNAPAYCLYDDTKQLITGESYRGRSTISFTSPSNARYFRFTHIKTATSAMVVEGTYTTSTMPAYEPYGYKLPFSSGGTTTPIYFGVVETTRKIGKLVFDGTEDWYFQSINAYGIANMYTRIPTIREDGICTHFKQQFTLISQTQDEGFLIAYATTPPAPFYLRIKSETVSTVAELKAYLAAQYAAGTPVTFWYALATEQTGILNEPIRKIGDYADSISMEQAGVSIPTVSGVNVVDVETTLKPSQIYLKYKGRSDS